MTIRFYLCDVALEKAVNLRLSGTTEDIQITMDKIRVEAQ